MLIIMALCRLLFLQWIVFSQKCFGLINNDESINDRLLALEGKMLEMTSKINNLAKSSKGTTYIRWGRQTCPTNGTELVYAGIAGGGLYSSTGSAAEYVCLPHDPNLLTNAVPTNPWGSVSHIYGAEYEDNLFGSDVFQRDVPCAVCHMQHASSILMIPGRNHCHSGWNIEYHGLLAAGADEKIAASQYVCVDKMPEVFERSGANLNGKLFYPVKASCGSLPCPPYVNSAFLTCVVCSK